MPFTFSHIAFALPLKRFLSYRLSATGLIIGSMMPDVEYYLRMQMYGTWGHELAGVLVYDILIGIICAFLFHLILKRPLLDHLPNYLKSKYIAAYELDWITYFNNNWLVIVLSLYLGVLTHMFWDIFTHEPGYVFGLKFTWLLYMIGNISLFNWMQVLLSIIGLGILLVIVFKPTEGEKIERTNTNESSPIRFWLVVFLFFILTYSIRYLIGIPSEKYWIQHMVITTSSLLVSLTLTSLIFSLFRRIDTIN